MPKLKKACLLLLLIVPFIVLVTGHSRIFSSILTAPPAQIPPPSPNTYVGPTYQVPAGVKITVLADNWQRDPTIPNCDNWPNTPTVLPCVEKISAVATDNRGAQGTASQWWYYDCEARLPNGKCKH